MPSRPLKGLITAASAALLTMACVPATDIISDLDDLGATEPIARFDGEWMGVEYAYGMTIKDRIGTVLQTNTSAYDIGDPILVILSVDGSRFDGKHIFGDARSHNVMGSLIDENTLSLIGGGYAWTMTRFKVNLQPTADRQIVRTQTNTPVDIFLTGDDPDEGPEPLSFIIEVLPNFGEISGDLPNIVYTPPADYIGNDSFAFSVYDGEDSHRATVLVRVGNDNQRPEIDAGSSQEIVYPVDTIELLGEAEDDGLPDDTLFVTWRVAFDSPTLTPVTFSSPNILDPTVTFVAPGIYRLELLADDGELTTSDTVTIGVGGDYPELDPPLEPLYGGHPVEPW